MKLTYLLVFLPIALALNYFRANPILIFLSSALALMPLADLMGDATEVLSRYVGATMGSVLSATLNNAPELIIGLFALNKGLVTMVKASLTGSILGNVLLGLGAAMCFGGLRHGEQKFDSKVAGTNGDLLVLATIGLLIPAVFYHGSRGEVREFSVVIAVAALVVYAAKIVFITLAPKSAGPIIRAEAKAEDRTEPPGRGPTAGWSWKYALGLLVLVTVGLAAMSEIMTGALEPTARQLGLTPIFAGIVLLAMVGGIPEFYNAVNFARSDQMDLAMGITLGNTTQVALLVAPVLVLSGQLLGQPMNLVFTPVEILAIVLAVFVVRNITADGQSDWLKGIMLLAVYFALAVGFYLLPASQAAAHPG
jgi:Ca2+:H+ antiporter